MSSIDSGSGTMGTEAAGGLFLRQSTGLIREVSPISAWVFNFIPNHPANILAVGLFFAFALFPGGNLWLALLLDVPLVLAFAYAYGFLTSMMPRAGGDYVFVGRVLHPALGLASSLCWVVSLIMSNAYFALAFVNVGVAPGPTGIGLVSGNPTLVNWGQMLAVSNGWKFAVTSLMCLVTVAFMFGGWRYILRIQNSVFLLTVVGLGVGAIVALFMSPSSFVHNFNDFALTYTGNPDTYNLVIANASKAGVPLSQGFSLAATVPLLGVLAIASIYPFVGCEIAGELRQARSMKTPNVMALAGIAGLVFIGLFGAIFLHTFGTRFVTAANAAGAMPPEIAASPTYFFLLSAAVKSTVLAVFVVITYAIYWPLNLYVNYMQLSRILFAWAFDGLLPAKVAEVSRRHVPWVCLIIVLVATEVALVWAVFSASFISTIVNATFLALVTMTLVGVTAAVVKWRRPELYESGATRRTLLGVPVVAISGVAAALSGVFVYSVYIRYPAFGLTGGIVQVIEWIAAGVGAGVVFYYVARAIRMRQGMNLDMALREIPPE